MRYRLSRMEVRDLEKLYADGLQKFGFDMVERYLGRILEAFDLLGEAPGLGVRHMSRARPVRLFQHGSHVLLYRAVAHGVEIVRVRHQRENWAAETG